MSKGGYIVADNISKMWRERYKRKQNKNKKWVSPEEYYGEKAWENILFFTKGQEAVEKWKKEKLEREANK
jgi:hypothetical protein